MKVFSSVLSFAACILTLLIFALKWLEVYEFSWAWILIPLALIVLADVQTVWRGR